MAGPDDADADEDELLLLPSRFLLVSFRGEETLLPVEEDAALVEPESAPIAPQPRHRSTVGSPPTKTEPSTRRQALAKRATKGIGMTSAGDIREGIDAVTDDTFAVPAVPEPDEAAAAAAVACAAEAQDCSSCATG